MGSKHRGRMHLGTSWGLFVGVLGCCYLAAASRVHAFDPPSEAPGSQKTNADSIWDKPIAGQPFDTQPLHSVRIPQWIQQTLGAGYTLSVMDGQHRAEAARHGVTLSEMGFVDPFYTYYDSQLLHKRSPHVPIERLRKEIEEYRRLGVRILGVYPPCLQSEVYENHPDWRRIATNTREIPTVDWKVAPHGGMLCLLGPYGDFFIAVLEEILTKFPEVDAFSFDGLHYGGVCYCEHCRSQFKKDTGKEIPNVSMEDPDFRVYQHWADRRMENLVVRMQTRLKGIKPTVGLVTWSTNAGRFGHFLSIPRNMPSRMNLLLDAPDQEFWLDETNRGASIVPAVGCAYIWATTNHRVAFSEPYLLSHGNPYGKDSFPPHEIERRMLLAATYGCAPSIAVAQATNLQEDLYRIMDAVQARKPWLVEKEPEPWAALLLSDNTRNFYGRDPGQVEQRYMASVFGAFRACVEEHLPFEIINDWNLNESDLSRYSVLILPNAACMDAQQIEAVEQFVRGGGGVVSSLDTSQFDAYGNARQDFGLSKLFGVHYAGLFETTSLQTDVSSQELDVNFAAALRPDYWEKRKNIFDMVFQGESIAKPSPLMDSKLRSYLGEAPVTFKGPAVRVSLDRQTNAQVFGKMQTKINSNDSSPAIVSNSMGSGKSVFFSQGVDSAYYLYPYPYQRLLLANAIRWVARNEPPVVVKAPMCVHTTLMRQSRPEGDRLVLHLYNDINSTAFHALPVDDVPLREETIPIHDIEVVFRSDYKIKKAMVQPENGELKTQSDTGGTLISIPRLDVHSMLVVELE